MPESSSPLPYQYLTPDLVIQAVESSFGENDGRVMALNSYENRVYQVGMEDRDPLIAKFYRPGRWSDHQIAEEHTFTQSLADAELPVVTPIANRQGLLLSQWSGFRYAMFPRKGGRAPEPGDRDQLYRIGMLLGRLHAIGKAEDFQYRPTLTIQRTLNEPVEVLLAGQFIPASLVEPFQEIISVIRTKVTASQLAEMPTIRVQGDCHPGNIIWTRDDGPWLLDFDDCQMAPAVQDLWMLLCGTSDEQEIQLSELLEGYTTFCTFEIKELALIESLRALRMIHYAGWIAMRWEDPTFPRHFPWFGTDAYWQSLIGDLQRQSQRIDEPPLSCY